MSRCLSSLVTILPSVVAMVSVVVEIQVVLVCHVILQDHVIQGSCHFIRNPLMVSNTPGNFGGHRHRHSEDIKF